MRMGTFYLRRRVQYGLAIRSIGKDGLLPLVRQEDVPVAEGLRLRLPEGDLLRDTLEHRPALSENDRNDHELVLVDQARLRQGRDDAAASQDDHVFARSLLHLPDLRREVTLHDSSVVPVRPIQGPGENHLRQVVHPLGDDRVALSGVRRRPVLHHEVVGLPSHEELAAAPRVLLDEGAELVVRLGSVGPLDVAVLARKVTVERHAVENAQLSHLAPPLLQHSETLQQQNETDEQEEAPEENDLRREPNPRTPVTLKSQKRVVRRDRRSQCLESSERPGDLRAEESAFGGLVPLLAATADPMLFRVGNSLYRHGGPPDWTRYETAPSVIASASTSTWNSGRASAWTPTREQAGSGGSPRWRLTASWIGIAFSGV